MTEISELQRKRAENLIWTCAEDYSFTPDFKAYDSEGIADLYWNCIIGAVRRHYEYPKIEAVLRALQQYEESETYESLLWLGLENCVFAREVSSRPVLARLRTEYAKAFTEKAAGSENALFHLDDDLFAALSLGHWTRVLGGEAHLSKYDICLLDELELSPELDTDALTAHLQELFSHWFQIKTEGKKARKRFSFPGLRKRPVRKGEGHFLRFGFGIADHPDNIYGGADAQGGDRREREVKTKLSAEELREFIETKYGKPVYDSRRISEIERSLCTKNHEGCHLHFTYGERVPASAIQNGFEALSRQREALQIEQNRKYYQDNIVRNRAAIAKLASNITNSVLMHLHPSPVKANSGALDGRLVWRAATLEDERVFTRPEHDTPGDLCVDILLDASTSQITRQTTISSQGYIIAEALTRCGIPCRVISFCSMTGYTILRIFRDYTRPKDNKNIFEYVSNGCNRDGLAIRAAHHLISEAPYENRILIVLSDVKPNDVVKILPGGGDERVLYEHLPGLTDTALEVRRARADGISVICIFTGEDEDLPSAKMVYGRDFVRIQSFDRLADTVGLLIRNQIKNME